MKVVRIPLTDIISILFLHMQNWLYYACFSVIGLTGYRILVKVLGNQQDANVCMMVSSFIYFIAWVFIVSSHGPLVQQIVNLSPKSQFIICILSFTFFLSDYFLLKAYSAGAELSTMTVLLSLSMVITTFSGFIIFKENFNYIKFLGIIFGLLSFYLLTLVDKNINNSL